MRVIYVDVLFAVNFFITFFLLIVTEKFSKRSGKIWRLVPASFIGGAYSLVILADELNFAVSFLGKLAAACLIVLTAFKYIGIKVFIKETAIFFFVNFLFVGIMVGLWLIFRPEGIVINNSTVYFNVSAKVLLITALAAYLISALIIRIYNGKTSAKEIYSVKVLYGGGEVRFFAFADSGNNLREPFSEYPVIVAEKKLFENVECQRLIPFKTIGGEGVMPAFKPEKVEISTSRGSAETQEVYIALSDSVKRGEYRGILNPKILNL